MFSPHWKPTKFNKQRRWMATVPGNGQILNIIFILFDQMQGILSTDDHKNSADISLVHFGEFPAIKVIERDFDLGVFIYSRALLLQQTKLVFIIGPKKTFILSAIFYCVRIFFFFLNNTNFNLIGNISQNIDFTCPVSWGCRIHRLHLCRGVRPPNECPRYDTKQSDGKVPVMLELWEMRSTSP